MTPLIATVAWLMGWAVASWAFFLLSRAEKREEKLQRQLDVMNASRMYWIAACERLQKIREGELWECVERTADIMTETRRLALYKIAHFEKLPTGGTKPGINIMDNAGGVTYEAHNGLLGDSGLIAASDKGNTEAMEA